MQYTAVCRRSKLSISSAIRELFVYLIVYLLIFMPVSLFILYKCSRQDNNNNKKKKISASLTMWKRSKHMKGSVELLFNRTHNLQIFGVIPFVKLQNDT